MRRKTVTVYGTHLNWEIAYRLLGAVELKPQRIAVALLQARLHSEEGLVSPLLQAVDLYAQLARERVYGLASKHADYHLGFAARAPAAVDGQRALVEAARAHNRKEAARRGLKKCKAPAMIREHLIEDFIRDKLCKRVDDELIRAELVAKEQKGGFETLDGDHGNGTSAIRRKLIKVREKQGRLADLYIDGQISKEILDERATALTMQSEILEEELKETERESRVKRNTLAELAPYESLSKEWPELNQKERRDIAGCFIREARIKSGDRGTDRVSIVWLG